MKVKALAWVQNWANDPLTGFADAAHINRTYTVDHDGPRFYVSTAMSPNYGGDDAIGNYDSFDEAKAAAQADYSARILAAIEQDEGEGWQDIASANRDGRPVMLWKAATREHYVAALVSGAHGPGWCTPDGFEIFGATHWRLLPEPPSSLPGDSGK